MADDLIRLIKTVVNTRQLQVIKWFLGIWLNEIYLFLETPQLHPSFIVLQQFFPSQSSPAPTAISTSLYYGEIVVSLI